MYATLDAVIISLSYIDAHGVTCLAKFYSISDR